MVFNFENSHHRIFFDKSQIKTYIEQYKQSNDSIYLKFLSDYLYKCLRVNHGWEERAKFKDVDRLCYIDNHKHATLYYGIWANYTSKIATNDTYARYKTYYTLDDEDFCKLTSANLLTLKKQLKDEITEDVALSFKTPRTLDYYIKDNERFVVHYSCKSVRKQVDDILDKWLYRFNLTTHKRFFNHGYDNQDTSHGCICADKAVNVSVSMFLKEGNVDQIVETLINTFYLILIKEV